MTGHSIPDPASVEENGRTYSGYYREGRYMLPNDGPEQDRLDLQHQVWRLLLDDALYLAPLHHHHHQEPSASASASAAAEDGGIKNVLDIGTGTGIWPIEFAEENPGARVVGTDLSLIQPPPDRVPPNCHFVREDSEEDEWVHEVEFDYIHMRAMLSCFTDHRAMIRKIYENLRPGGWFESQDFNFDLVPADAATEVLLANSYLQQWNKLIVDGMKELGRDLHVATNYAQWLKDAGFVDVQQKLLLCPLNPWPRNRREQEIGLYFETNSVESLEGLGVKILTRRGMPVEEIQTWVARVEQDIMNRQMHIYTSVYVIYGRKPWDDGESGDDDDDDGDMNNST
ncbi:hypothetical protein PG987_001737 [Apiospora arundinis]